ncbi:MAG: hypothetical protein WBC44_09430 [Planctomycetaceae bacterium]
MAAPAFPNQIPVAEIGDLIAAVRSGDYVGKETVRTALYVGGCVNELRGPTPFGAEASDLPHEAEIVGELPDDKLCDAVAHHVHEASAVGAAGDESDSGSLPPVVTVFLFELLSRVLRRFLDR